MKRKQTPVKSPPSTPKSNLSITALAPGKFMVAIGKESRQFKSVSNAKAYVMGYLTATDWKNRG